MRFFQKIKLWWVVFRAKTTYSTWYNYSYGHNDNYDRQVDRKLGDRAILAERRMNIYRAELDLPPLWCYAGGWSVADGKTKGGTGWPKTANEYWRELRAVEEWLDRHPEATKSS